MVPIPIPDKVVERSADLLKIFEEREYTEVEKGRRYAYVPLLECVMWIVLVCLKAPSRNKVWWIVFNSSLNKFWSCKIKSAVKKPSCVFHSSCRKFSR